MEGYLFNFYKFSPTTVGENDVISNEFKRCIVWSTFDRLEIRKIDGFREYRLSKYSEKNWLGERQSAMVYEFDNDYNVLNYKKSGDECEFVFDVKDPEKNNLMRFFGVTIIDLTPEAHSYFYGVVQNNEEKTGEIIHKTLRKTIDGVIKNNTSVSNIEYEVYGVLGGQDAVIVWLANQFEDIAKVLEGFRKSKTTDRKTVIANIYSIIGLKNVNDDNINYDDVKGKLQIKLTKKHSYDDILFKDELAKKMRFSKNNEQKYPMLFGEHDFMMPINGSSLISSLYKRNGIFNSKSENFKKNFIQSKTEIIVDCKFDEIIAGYFDINIGDLKIDIVSNDKIKEYKQMIEQIVKSKCFKNAPYLQETVWLLFEDFLKNIMSSFSYPWLSDLDYQFENCLKYLSALVKSSINKKKKYANIQSLVGNMRQMMLHIAQANRIFFDLPNTYLEQTGAYSKILHTYYGIIKKYLKLVYSIEKYDSQSAIIPFITFDATPIAKSKYCDFVEGYDSLIIKIELPYEALVDISKYMKLLAHEIYHYIAPSNRVKRNLLISQMSFSIIMGQMTKILILDKIAPSLSEYTLMKEISSDMYDKKFMYISNLVKNKIINTPDLYKKYKKWIPNYKEDAEWRIYFDAFTDTIISGLKGQSGISEFLFSTIHTLEYDKSMDQKTIEIIDLLKKFEYDDYIEWLEKEKPIQKTNSQIIDLMYSLREAMADHFMIQVTNMSIQEYIELIYNYGKEVFMTSKDMKQRYRVALILNHYLGGYIKEVDFITGKNADEIIAEIIKRLKIKISFEKGIYHNYDDDTKGKIYLWLADCYKDLILGLNIYDNIFTEYFNSLDFKELNNEKYHKKFTEYYQDILSIFNTESNNEFDNNIRYIEKFQHQDELRELENEIIYISPNNRPDFFVKSNEKEYYAKSSDKKDYISILKVNSLVELFHALKNSISNISDDDEDVPIWFRGQTNKNYLLIPSLYRMKDKKTKFYNASMRETFLSLIDLFKANSYNAPEIINKEVNSLVNSIISMQHYSVPTNTLDWSTSAFVAMYFALEYEINNEDNSDSNDAAIYVLNPFRLNLARALLTKPNNTIESEKDKLKFPIIPFDDDDDRLKEYLPNFKANNNVKQYPVAVYAPYVNQRIKAQNGTFLLYGLDNKGKEEKNNSFEIVARDYSEESLYDMQKEYKTFCENRGVPFKKFLTEVQISKESKKTIGDSLRAFGIDKSHIYPELENISKKLTNQVKAYFDLKEK